VITYCRNSATIAANSVNGGYIKWIADIYMETIKTIKTNPGEPFMISTKELKGQIDELTEQHQFLTQQLEQIKQSLQNQNDNQSQNQNQNKQQTQGGQQNQSNQGQSSDSGSNSQNQSGNNGNQITNIANEFLKLKGLTSSLENKMRQYSSNKSSSSSDSSLKEEDVINLMLNMMNGMIDWTIEYVSKQSGSSNQSQQ
jgi:hypothetical protein